jgi:hypothetical protein
MSIGFISENVATYSTFPRALRGASLMSVTMAFFGSVGSSSRRLADKLFVAGRRFHLHNFDARDPRVEGHSRATRRS